MDDEYGIEGSAKKFGEKVEEAARDLADGAATGARATVNQATGRVKSAANAGADEMRGLRDHLAVAVKDQPLASLLVVGGLGLIFGFLMRR